MKNDNSGIVSRYGTFLVIPPVVGLIMLVALTFRVTTRTEITLVQTAPGRIAAYMPSAPDADTLRAEAPETGALAFAIDGVEAEASAVRVKCRGTLPGGNTLLKAYIPSQPRPIAAILLDRL